jgi:hypothetical protein
LEAPGTSPHAQPPSRKGQADAGEPFPVAGRISGQAAATGERLARPAAAAMRWQLTIMTIKLPRAPPARTAINAEHETGGLRIAHEADQIG